MTDPHSARGARLALRARTAGGHASAVDEALTKDRSLIVTWADRGTLHLIAVEDEPLLQRPSCSFEAVLLP